MRIKIVRSGESVEIGEFIELNILGVDGDEVRIGIEAPPDVLASLKLGDSDLEGISAKWLKRLRAQVDDWLEEPPKH